MPPRNSTPAPDEYTNIREWRRFDDKTLKNHFYVPGDPYDGPILPVLLSPAGPDGKGPVIAKVAAPAASGAPEINPPAASGEEK